MLAVFLLLLSFAKDCDGNDQDKISSGCKSRGLCIRNSCYCCGTDIEECPKDFGIAGRYRGNTCDKIEVFVKVDFGFLIRDNVVNVTCDNDGSSSPDLVDLAQSVTGYNGDILSRPCQVCTPEFPCDEFGNTPYGSDEEATSGILVKFRTYLNSYYNKSCPQEDDDFDCPENYDDGVTAKSILYNSLTNDIFAKVDSYMKNEAVATQIFYEAPSKLISGTTRTRQPSPFPTELPTNSPTPMPTPEPTQMPTQMPTTPMPTQIPSELPTNSPTQMPTQSPTLFGTITTVCEPFSDKIENFRWVDRGIGASCRGGINESWPGGRKCESPYLICLPKENTPAGTFLNRTYFNDTHRYSVKECQRECRFDQRCRGFEFVADADSNRGDCILIDDVDIVVVDRPEIIDFEYIEDLSNLHRSETGGDALCFEKFDNCHPYFGAHNLSETMLACYCPNNRKGSYTKKVKRTVSNTRYCGDDESMNERIKLAHANRMFHLCENWCLFNTLNPEQESWYWDPWNTCWRETYSGRGAHRAYCDRVIRNPDSIELQFVNRRADNFISCNETMIPTVSPVDDFNVTYFLSAPVESCDEACSKQNRTCAADQTSRVFSSETELKEVFGKAGFTCKSENIVMNRTNWEGWALPGLGYGRLCANRLPTLSHLEDLDSDCNRKIGNGWQRLCACY